MKPKQLAEVQSFLQAQKINGWLVCDFRGSNPFAQRVLELGELRRRGRRYA